MELTSTGWSVWYGQFTRYGQEITSVPTDFKYKFPGKERDPESGTGAAETGNDYFGARYASTMGPAMWQRGGFTEFGAPYNPGSAFLWAVQDYKQDVQNDPK